MSVSTRAKPGRELAIVLVALQMNTQQEETMKPSTYVRGEAEEFITGMACRSEEGFQTLRLVGLTIMKR